MVVDRRNQEIDKLRGIAILLVVLHHLRLTFLRGYLPDSLTETWSGVDLFFVISGFVVTRSFTGWLGESGISWRTALTYFLRRLMRILPVAWLWAIIPVVLAKVCNESGYLGDPEIVFKEMVAVFEFIYNFFSASTGYAIMGGYWSLAVEEQFYLFLPFFLVFVRPHSFRLLALVGILITAAGMRIGDWFNHEAEVREFMFFTQYRLDGLAIGTILGLSADRLIAGVRLKPHMNLWLKILSGALIAAVWTLPGLLETNQTILYGFVLLALSSGGLVALACLEKDLIPPFGWLGKAMTVVGRRSYTIYLVHFPLMLLVLEIRFRIFASMDGWPSVAAALAALAAYLAALALVTEGCYRALETPLIGAARKLFPAPARALARSLA